MIKLLFIFNSEILVFFRRFFNIILLPLLLIFIFVLIWDPFKVFFTYDDYYKNNKITNNREHVCLKLFKHRNFKSVNLIIGNSRSLAFKTGIWSRKINQNPKKCFHYDGSAMGIYRTTKALQYLDKNTQKINNILLIVDTDFFNETKNPKGHLFIQPPEVSEESSLSYYNTFIKASLNYKFIVYNLIYSTTGKYYDFMEYHINKSRYDPISNNQTGDICVAYEKDIEDDSIIYYKKLLNKNIFFKRPKIEVKSQKLIHQIQLKLLKKIKKIIVSNNCNIKIVIAPLYNQLKINLIDIKKLNNIFGKKNVFDFSGKNIYTEHYYNYYESSHFKPYIANDILNFIYKKNKL